MQYVSTRGGAPVSAAQAIARGLCPLGGLYVPTSFPPLDLPALLPLADDYCALAARILARYLPDTGEEALRAMTQKAYASFDDKSVTPLHRLTDTETVLELWHGPTMAFKDVALQLLPYLMRDSLDRIGETRTVYILVATSGDTGKAALEGFRDVSGTRVLVFYPHGGVSEAQRLQMVTQEGANVDVCAVEGNFDDAQTAVKQIFSDADVRKRLSDCGYLFSSANSINFGRLVPQIVYYVSSYLRLVKLGAIALGDDVNFCVPTGNFGDILAGYYAKRMGLPVHRLLLASNRNNVLSDFFRQGVYDVNRPFYRDMSCSIDILLSSNLERLLFEVLGRDAQATAERMRTLKETGSFSIDASMRMALADVFFADWCTEEGTTAAIRRTFDTYGYLIDPHTAVAQTIYERYQAITGDTTQTILLSTANPYKFSTAVLNALEPSTDDDFQNAALLSARTHTPIPESFAALKSKPTLHPDVVTRTEMEERVIAPLMRL